VPVAPEFGPTLPALLRARRGVPERLTIAVIVALVALLGFAMVTVRAGGEYGEQLVHGGAPVFNVLYDDDALRAVEPRAGELVRIEGARGRQSVAVTVRPLRLPPFEGDVAHGLLPAYASGHVEELASQLDGFKLLEDGRARVNDAPGYEVTFRSGPARAPAFGSDVLVIPSEVDARGAVVLSLRRRIEGRAKLSEDEKELSAIARSAFRSFRYGTDRG
jgi:hypothetical protein